MNQDQRVSTVLNALQTRKGSEQEIIGVGRDDLPWVFKALGFKTGVEIGVCKGEYTEKFCQAGLKMYGVDPWTAYDEYDTPGMQKRLDAEYEETVARLSKYECTLIRKTSAEAAKDFADESIDFVYIDGHHMLKYVVMDLCDWSTKVRKGGAITGHDFVRIANHHMPYMCHVKQAVRAYTDAFNVPNWFILGRKHFPKDSNEVRDKWRSFMWLKL